MRMPALILFSLGLLMPATAGATNRCPWLTEGSAAAALGGSVSATAQVSESGEGFCTFSREQGDSKVMLKILVQRAVQPSCPTGSAKLKGIGNEAVMCTERPSPEESVEKIVSRVRELHFTVSITIHKQSPRSPDMSPPEGALEQLAEQVAGNLF